MSRCTRAQHELDVAIAVEGEFKGKDIDSQRLTSQHFLKFLFWNNTHRNWHRIWKMMKHCQLMTHAHELIRERLTHSSANKFERLFQGVGNQIKSLTKPCFFVCKHHVCRPFQECHLWETGVLCANTKYYRGLPPSHHIIGHGKAISLFFS